MGSPFIAGEPSDPVIYQAVVRPSSPSDIIGLIKITGVRTDKATITDADSGLNTIGAFVYMSWPYQPVFAVDPNNPNHLIAA